MKKTDDESYDLLENIKFDNYQWHNDKNKLKKLVGEHEIDAIIARIA